MTRCFNSIILLPISTILYITVEASGGLSNRESGGATKEGDRMKGESADVAGGAGGGREPGGGRAE